MSVVEINEVVDARGLSHTGAIALTERAVERLEGGAVFEVLSTDPGSPDDVVLWCRSTGDLLLSQATVGPVYHFVVRRRRVWTADPNTREVPR